jgi:hypothetical protein
MFRVAGLAGGLVLALLAGVAFSEADDYRGMPFHPFTLNGCTGIPVHEGHANCDPINVVFPGRGAAEVLEALQTQGWTTAGFGSRQYLHLSSETLLPQTAQLFLHESADKRYHIRLWDVPGGTIGGVHHEAGIIEHVIDRDWEDAEAFVSSQLCQRPNSCEESAVVGEQHAAQGGDEEWRNRGNDARALIIRLR